MKKCANPVLLTVIIAALSFSLVGCGGSRRKTSESKTTREEQGELAEEAIEEEVVEEQPIDYATEFIARFNALSDTPLEVVETFEPHDNTSPHYRHEFYLDAYRESVGTYCTMGEAKLWIVSGILGDFRVYSQGPLETVRTVFLISTRVLNPDTTEVEVEECINEVLDSKYLSQGSIIDSSFSAYFFKQAGKENAGELVAEDEGKVGYYDILLEQWEGNLDMLFSE